MSGNLKVDIVDGVLASLKVDVIVNSSNTALLLDYGGMSKALVGAAGRDLQAECAQKYPNGIEFGTVAVTKGHKLNCKEVFHVALPEWESQYANALQVLQKTVSSCLELAESHGMESIAFPALGCGFLNYPHDVVAQTMHYCENKFKSERISFALRRVTICIWPKGLDWKHIKEAFVKESSADGLTMPVVNAAAKDGPIASKQDFMSTCFVETNKYACRKVLKCGHICRGYKDEQTCPPCLKRNCSVRNKNQTEQDDCIICYTDQLGAAPVIQLQCGHLYHLHCVKRVLENRWVGARITFNFAHCPLCKTPMDHPGLNDILDPITRLYQDVERKSLMRLQFEGLQNCPEIQTESSPYYKNCSKYAMDRYCYYPCFKCQTPYFGGTAQCGDEAEANYKAEEMVCPICCSTQSNDQVCSKHGTDFIEYKCRYCCSVAVFFCFGTTHFCNACHSNHHAMATMGSNLPHCPAGPVGRQLTGTCPLGIQHPPNGTEFCLGCGLCSNLNTF